MTKKITLPSGASVTLRDPKSFRVKDRKRLMKAVDNTEGGELTRAMALSDALIAMLIEDWSFDLIIPSVKADTLDELEMADYDFLMEQTKEAQKFLYPNLKEDDENINDPKANTENSNA